MQSCSEIQEDMLFASLERRVKTWLLYFQVENETDYPFPCTDSLKNNANFSHMVAW